MNFKELCKIEPGLKILADDIIRFRDSKNYKKRDVITNWYRYYKPRLLLLVGYQAKTPQMQRADFYDTAYLYLFYLLDKEKPLEMLPLNEFREEGYKCNFLTPGASQKNNISRPEENIIFDKKLNPIKQKKQRAGRPVLDMRRVRKIEDRIINAIDRKESLQPIID